MTPWLENEHFPSLPLQLTIRGRTLRIEALIDTGFDGYVALPPLLLAGGESPDDFQPWLLADGSEVVAPLYLGAVRVGDVVSVPAAITALGDEPIVGRGVTDRFRLILDHGRRVLVEQ